MIHVYLQTPFIDLDHTNQLTPATSFWQGASPLAIPLIKSFLTLPKAGALGLPF
jgi:hypothetical protein